MDQRRQSLPEDNELARRFEAIAAHIRDGKIRGFALAYFGTEGGDSVVAIQDGDIEGTLTLLGAMTALQHSLAAKHVAGLERGLRPPSDKNVALS